MKQPDFTGGDDQNLSFEPLFICAILRWFDRELLRELAGMGEEAIEEWLASDLVVPAMEAQAAYQLREDVRAEALARLRSERPSDELTLHRRFFDHALRRIFVFETNDQRAAGSAMLLYHLGELFLLIAGQQAWHVLVELVATARAVEALPAQVETWLSFYEGFVAIRTQQYERGESLLRSLLGRDDIETKLRIQALNGLGQSHWFQARYDQAIALYGQVLDLARQHGDVFYQGVALANLGWAYEAIHQYDQAIHFALESLTIFRTLGDKRREAHALYDIGMYALRLGRWEIAQTHFQQAIGLHEAMHSQAGLAHLYWGMGLLYHLFGNEAQSEAAYRQAQTFPEADESNQTMLPVDIYFQLGFLYQTQDRLEEALSAYDRAAALAAQLRDPYSATFIHYRRGNVFECAGRPDDALEAYRAALDGIERLRGDTQAEDIKIGLLGTVQQVYESVVRLCLARGQVAEAFEYVEQARSRALLDMLAVKRQGRANGSAPEEAADELHDELAAPVVTLADVQAALPPDALLVEFYTTGVLPRGEALINKIPRENARLREHLTLPPQVVGFAITHEHVEVFYPTVDPNTLRPQPGDPGPGRRLLRDRLLTHLHDQLIAPLTGLLTGKAQLFVIPHGPLHYVPFMALRSAAGEHLLQAGGPALALAPSATVLLRSCLGQPRGRGVGAVALGYNDEGDDCLRYAEIEAGHVAALVGGAAWVGPAPKRAPLAEHGGRARWLHIAGHAVFDPHDPLGSYIHLGRGERLSAREIMGGLELRADLVTLSACMSGVTHVVPGDELLGLQRAFLYAGAPAVVCTLWEAADFVTLVVMDRFYADLARGRAPGVALRDAQAAVRAMTGRDLLDTIERWRAEDPDFVAALGELPEIPPSALDIQLYADPFYWAPFMLIGRPD